MNVMLDTNIFNEILDGKLEVNIVPRDVEIHVTHVQCDEIRATKDEERRKKLLETFSNVLGVSEYRLMPGQHRSLPTETAIWDVSNWDEAKFSDGSGKYDAILSRLKELDPRQKKSMSHIKDALIAETAMMNNLVLVTADKILLEVVLELGGMAMHFEKFLAGGTCHGEQGGC